MMYGWPTCTHSKAGEGELPFSSHPTPDASASKTATVTSKVKIQLVIYKQTQHIQAKVIYIQALDHRPVMVVYCA